MTFTPTRRSLLGAAALSVPTLALASCGGGEAERNADGNIELTMAAWSIATTPEFEVIVEGFEAAHPDAAITLKEYSADDYDTQLTTDLSANSAPDVFPLKNLEPYFYYQSNGALADLTEQASALREDGNIDVDILDLDGSIYALPYRQDSWVVYYNKEMFAAAGIDEPDGSWTWDEFVDMAAELTTALEDTDYQAKGAYMHNWQSIVQAFALAQTEGADLASGDLSYLAPYYERLLAMQDAGSTETFSTVDSQSLSYQAQFGTQKAAMMPMGTWYIGTLLAQRESGDADEFEWGMAPAPQQTSGVGPISFGDPTTLAINAELSGEKLEVAQSFLDYIVSEDCSKALAEIGITPSYFSEDVVDTIFALDGMPEDELSRAAFSETLVEAENPIGEFTNDIITILEDTHSEILTESSPVDEALTKAEEQLENEGLTA